MKRTILYLSMIAVLGTVFILTSCDLFETVSIEDRLARFEDALNASTERGVNANFHSLMGGGGVAEAWDDAAFSTTQLRVLYQTFTLLSISTPTDSGLGNGIMYVDAELTSGGGVSPTTIRFNMRTDLINTNNWLILAMDIPAVAQIWGSPVVP